MTTSPGTGPISLRRLAMLLRELAVYTSEDRERAAARGDEAHATWLGWRWQECVELAAGYEALARAQEARAAVAAVVPVPVPLPVRRVTATVARAVLWAIEPAA